jgi:hypothetical protein|nr:MAG TPA: hypothetical protein [Crassvirales sp.]
MEEKKNYLKLILIKKDFLDKVQLKSTYGGDTYRRRTLSVYGTNIATSYVYSGLWFTVQGYYVIIANKSSSSASEVQIDRTLVCPQIKIPRYTEHIKYGNIIKIPGVKFKNLIRSEECKGTALISYGIGMFGIKTYNGIMSDNDIILKCKVSRYSDMALHLLKKGTKEYSVVNNRAGVVIIPKETIFSLQEFLEEKEVESPVIILKLNIYDN